MTVQSKSTCQLIRPGKTYAGKQGLSYFEGISAEQVYVALIAPTARQLGHQAETEQRPFDEVASALDTIHKVIESLRLSPR